MELLLKVHIAKQQPHGSYSQNTAAFAHGKLLQKRNQLAGKFRKGMPLKALLYIKYDEWHEHNQRCAEQRLKLQYLKDAQFRAARRAYGSGRIISGHKH